MFDDFTIVSGNVYFSHTHDKVKNWILESQKSQSETGVFMKSNNNTARTTKQVFDSFTSDEEYGFTKTVVSVCLAQYGDEKLVSRSQAKGCWLVLTDLRWLFLILMALKLLGKHSLMKFSGFLESNIPELNYIT